MSPRIRARRADEQRQRSRPTAWASSGRRRPRAHAAALNERRARQGHPRRRDGPPQSQARPPGRPRRAPPGRRRPAPIPGGRARATAELRSRPPPPRRGQLPHRPRESPRRRPRARTDRSRSATSASSRSSSGCPTTPRTLHVRRRHVRPDRLEQWAQRGTTVRRRRPALATIRLVWGDDLAAELEAELEALRGAA
jgi:hypothetical protein